MISKQALGKTLWGMANILRDKVEDYKTYILPLLFYKRLSDNYRWEDENNIKQFIKEKGRAPNKAEKSILLEGKHDFAIPDGCFWEDVKAVPILLVVLIVLLIAVNKENKIQKPTFINTIEYIDNNGVPTQEADINETLEAESTEAE